MNRIQTLIRNKFVAFLMLVSFVFVALLVYNDNKRSKEIRSYKSIIQTQSAEIKNWKDYRQRWHNTTEVTNVQSTQALEMLVKYDKAFAGINENFTTIKKNFKNLEYMGVVGMQSNYDLQRVPIRDTIIMIGKDTSKTLSAQVFSIKDSSGWYSIKAVIVGSKLADIDIKTKDSISTAITVKRKWLFGRRRYYQEIVSHNPYSNVVFSRTVTMHK